MAAKTKISWADSTCNLWIGCVEVTPACDHCYARELAERYGWTNWGGPRVYCKAGWALARKLQRAANDNGGVDPELGRRRRVFVNSLSDFFDNHKTIVWRDAAWQLIRECPDVIFMLLTKRPENIRKMLPDDWGDGWDNVWIGTTVEDQLRAEHRIPHLLSVPARVHFLSMEPLLGGVDLRHIRLRASDYELDALTGVISLVEGGNPRAWPQLSFHPLRRLAWIVAGGESGSKARISDPAWFFVLRDQCAETSTPFHFKQWGEWLPCGGPFATPKEGGGFLWAPAKSVILDGKKYTGNRIYNRPQGPVMVRVGTKNSGHMLHGREHLAFPQDIRKAA